MLLPFCLLSGFFPTFQKHVLLHVAFFPKRLVLVKPPSNDTITTIAYVVVPSSLGVVAVPMPTTSKHYKLFGGPAFARSGFVGARRTNATVTSGAAPDESLLVSVVVARAVVGTSSLSAAFDNR